MAIYTSVNLRCSLDRIKTIDCHLDLRSSDVKSWRHPLHIRSFGREMYFEPKSNLMDSTRQKIYIFQTSRSALAGTEVG